MDWAFSPLWQHLRARRPAIGALVGAPAVALSTLSGCTEASAEGTAVLRNATGAAFYEVVIRDPQGLRVAGGTLEKV